MWFRKATVPVSNDTKEINVVQTWEVRWRSRHGSYSSDTREEVEVFTNEETAKEFRDSLVKAFKLVKNTSDDSVSLKKKG